MRFFIYFFSLILLASCSVIQNTPKFGLQDGIYDAGNEKVYVETQNDTLWVSAEKGNQSFALPTGNKQDLGVKIFRKSTFDLDVLAIPVKYRGSQAGLPPQLASEINASLYFGKRKDYFQVSYDQTPSKKYKRKLDHYGFSLGGFVGFGNTIMNSDVSQGQLGYEYQAVTFSKGVAGIIGINNFTLGFAFGFDQLLDKNASYWIYDQKPWLGLALGLNLN